MKRVWLGLALTACGVPGRPVPPGPTPPAAPSNLRFIRVPTGLEVRVEPPGGDLDGERFAVAPTLLLFTDNPGCTGAPAASFTDGIAQLAVADGRLRSLRAVAVISGLQGPATVPLQAGWRAPPPAPEAPLVFVSAGKVQITWLPPAAAHVLIVRDGRVVGERPARDAGWQDVPPPGRHRYRIVARGADFRTAPSLPAVVVVPAQESK